MSWLPAVRFAEYRWWLPLSVTAADWIVARLAGSGRRDDDSSLLALLHDDPPLAIFAASLCGPDQNVSLATLANHLSANLDVVFARGDAFLGAPTCQEPFAQRWEYLRTAFLRMPRSQWLRAADQWLSLTGPPVPESALAHWPARIEDSTPLIIREDTNYARSSIDIPLLVRKLRRADTLAKTFDHSLRNAKSAALKQFAYGLSHEINNPLANISARAQGLMRDETDSQRHVSLQRIIDQSLRAHEMVADLMFYAHPPVPQLTSFDFAEIFADVAEQSVGGIVGRDIEIVVIDSAAPIPLRADRSMLLEAVRALVRNSIEAIGCGGRIELVATHSQQPTDRVTVLVRDSGPGLSAEARRHAFDPYFSGREAGRGLGVGLCRVERIAALHGGGVSLQSGMVGCVARLWLPTR